MFMDGEGGTEMQSTVRPRDERRSGSKEHEASERLCTCRLCQLQFPPSQLPHKLTMKMLIQAEKQLRVSFSPRIHAK